MAEYSLADVKAAALQLNIEYRGVRVYRDIANLGYTLEEVAQCLGELTEQDYRKSHYYQHSPPDDEYIYCHTRVCDGIVSVDRLYIKFCLIDESLIIDIGSFHLPRF